MGFYLPLQPLMRAMRYQKPLARRRALGYREIKTAADSILGPAGTIARGHEFHYSEMGQVPAEVSERQRRRQWTRSCVAASVPYLKLFTCAASYISPCATCAQRSLGCSCVIKAAKKLRSKFEPIFRQPNS